jgi:hypothetical protein
MPTAADLMAMPEDAFQAHATREAAMAMGEWLLAGVKLQRPIRSLTRVELECLASAAISRWITVRAERSAAGRPDPQLFAI